MTLDGMNCGGGAGKKRERGIAERSRSEEGKKKKLIDEKNSGSLSLLKFLSKNAVLRKAITGPSPPHPRLLSFLIHFTQVPYTS